MKKIIVTLLFSFISLFAFENLTADNFDKSISNKNVVVDFYHTWWPSCKALGKSLTSYNASKTENVTIYKVDLAKEPELAKRFNVRAFPAVFYMKNGETIAMELGDRTAEEIKQNVKKYFNQ